MKFSYSLQNVCKATVHVWYVGKLPYQPTYCIQQYLAARHAEPTNKVLGGVDTDAIVLVEHPPVFTTGIRGKSYSDSEESKLRALGADFYRTNRGGLITFHGPGQLVAYPILNLHNFNKSMRWYICKLEETVIQLCKSLGIDATRSSDTGVWVKNNKICAIGVHGSRYITTHGLALNCNTNMNWFSYIVPCGISDKGVTSLTEVLGRQTTVSEILPSFLKSFSQEFDCVLKPLPLQHKLNIANRLRNEQQCSSSDIEKQLLGDIFNDILFCQM